MEMEKLFSNAIGIVGPWFIRNVEFEGETKQLREFFDLRRIDVSRSKW